MTLPPCDRHKNLQMVPSGTTFVCPVPSCGRCHDDQGYFEMAEGQLVLRQSAALTRIFSTREQNLMAVRARAGG